MEQLDFSYGKVQVIRKAELDDCDFVLNLRNKSYVRDVSWNKDIISKEEHKKFWAKNYGCYWIVQELSANKSIGFIRIKNNEVSIVINKPYWNQGYGYFAMQEITKMFPDLKVEVKVGNNRSLCFFVKCGYVPNGFILEKIK